MTTETPTPSEDETLEPEPEPAEVSVAVPTAPRAGFWRRLANTPLRDLLRGRISGRLDVRFFLREAQLPAPLSRLVRKVIDRTRLWRIEKADVGRELITHFRDGLDRGESADALIAAFGPPRLAARLIGRARRRGRPALWRASVRTAQAAGLVLVALVGIYVAATIRLFTGEPVIERDYLKEINATARAVPEHSRAWDRYREALLTLGEVPPGMLKGEIYPGAERWGEAVQYLEGHAETLAMVRQGASYPGLGYLVGYGIDGADRALWPGVDVVDPGEGSVKLRVTGALAPYLGSLRTLTWLLSVDALRAAERGDGEVAIADVEGILGIAEQSLEVPFLLNSMVAHAMVSLGVTTMGELLADQPEVFTDEQLMRFVHRLNFLFDGRLHAQFAGEAMVFEDLVQRLYTDDGHGDGRLTAKGLSSMLSVGVDPLAPVAALVMAGRRAYTEEYRRWLSLIEAEFAKPLWRRDPVRLARETSKCANSIVYRSRYPFVAGLMRVFLGVGTRPELVMQERDAVRIAIALELYRRRHGSWPSSLGQLVPDLLPRIPPDRYDGAPLRYRLVEGEPVIYSVGADRNDGGLLTPSGDWILWPVVRPQWGEPDVISRRASRAGEG